MLPQTPEETFNIQAAAKMMDRFQSLFPIPINIHYWLLTAEQNYTLTNEINGAHRKGQAVIWSLSGQSVSADNWKLVCQNHRLGGIAGTNELLATDVGPTIHWLFENSPEFTYVRY